MRKKLIHQTKFYFKLKHIYIKSKSKMLKKLEKMAINNIIFYILLFHNKIIMKFLKILISLLLFLNIGSAFAAAVDHFDVQFNKQEANVWEALDLTIKAVDANWEVVKDYLGNIIGFSETDDSVELPSSLSSDKWYTFKAWDEWVVKFENWVIFHKPWAQTLWIYDSDANANIVWIWKIKIDKAATPTNIDIEILSPENWLTIWKNSIKVSWKTQKNHQILIKINNDKEFNTISNTDWTFEKEVTWLKTWDNTIQAYILDADSKKIWTSNKISIKVDDTIPKFKKITLAPLNKNWEVDEWTNIIVNVYATTNLKELDILINDQIIKLEETENWVYTWNFNAPKWWKTYDISAILKDNLWHNITIKDIAKIIVKKVELKSANNTWTIQKPKKIKKETKINNNNLEITWLKLVKLKNKSILTWNTVTWATAYNVYKRIDDKNNVLIQTVKKPIFTINITWKKIKHEFFMVKALKENNSWEVIKEWNLSQATEIQTWPQLYILLILSFILWAWFIYYRKIKNA